MDQDQTQFLGVRTRQDLERRLRALISAGQEGKVDFKAQFSLSTGAEKAEFAKDVSSIANTDDPRLDGFGYIILGARRGELVGGISAWRDRGEDNYSATITNVLKEYLAPVPFVHLVTLEDENVGGWGVVVIPPSHQQPHIFARDTTNAVKHEWFVRINDTTERAGVVDYARVMSKAAARVVRPLEVEIQRMALRLASLESSDTQGVAALVRDALKSRDEPSSSPSPPDTAATPATRVRRALQTPVTATEDILAAEALRVAEVMSAEHPDVPWITNQLDLDASRRLLTRLEDEARPFAEALAAVVRYDREGRHIGAIRRALRIVFQRPVAPSGYTTESPAVRMLPATIVAFSAITTAIHEERGDVLRAIFDVPYLRLDRPANTRLASGIAASHDAYDFYTFARQRRGAEPVAFRIAEAVPPMIAAYVVGARRETLFRLAEFIVALAHEKETDSDYGSGVPLGGTFLYVFEAADEVYSMLRGKPQWMRDALGDVEALLTLFDANVEKVAVQTGFPGRTLRGGTLAAWGANEKRPA